MISPNCLKSFRTRGFLRLEGHLPTDKVRTAHRATIARLEGAGLRKDDTWQLDGLRQEDWLIDSPRYANCLKRTPEIEALFAGELPRTVHELLSDHVPDPAAARPMAASPQILLTLPSTDRWTVPHSNWHLDMPRRPDNLLPGVQVFTFLDRVPPGGGGTLAVAGSHQLLNTGERISSKKIKQRLKMEPYFRDLMSREVQDREDFLRREVPLHGTSLQVVEFHGSQGDVVLTDLRLLHTIAPNASQQPRIMATQRYAIPETS